MSSLNIGRYPDFFSLKKNCEDILKAIILDEFGDYK